MRKLYLTLDINVNIKAVPQHTYGGAGREEIQLLLIHDLGTTCGEWSVSRPGRALPPGKGFQVLILQEAGWAPEPFWTQRLEEASSFPCRGSNLVRPVVQSVARHYTD
jgi:hypothetical protein